MNFIKVNLAIFALVFRSISAVLSPEDIAEIDREFRAGIDRLGKFEDKDLTIFMGATGAGKSTLVNLCADVPLEIDDYLRIVCPGERQGLEIGAGTTSVTSFPQYLESKNGDIYLDVPGFAATQGTRTELLNHAFLRSILTKANLVKVVYVMEEADLTARRSEGLRGLKEPLRFLGQDFLNSSLGIIVNKAVRTPAGFYQTYIGSYLEEIRELPEYQDEVGKTIIRILENQEKIMFVDRPKDQEDAFFGTTSTNLKHFIKQYEGGKINLREAPSLTTEMRNEVSDYLNEHIKSELLKANDIWQERIDQQTLDVLADGEEKKLREEFMDKLRQSPTMMVLKNLIEVEVLAGALQNQADFFDKIISGLKIYTRLQKTVKSINENQQKLASINQQLERGEIEAEEAKIKISHLEAAIASETARRADLEEQYRKIGEERKKLYEDYQTTLKELEERRNEQEEQQTEVQYVTRRRGPSINIGGSYSSGSGFRGGISFNF